MTLGSAGLAGGAALFFTGFRLSWFFLGNAVVGVAWALAYVGASAAVAGTYRPQSPHALPAQGLCDSGVLLGTGLAVCLAGLLYTPLGWSRYAGLYVGVAGGTLLLDVSLLIRNALVARKAARA